MHLHLTADDKTSMNFLLAVVPGFSRVLPNMFEPLWAWKKKMEPLNAK